MGVTYRSESTPTAQELYEAERARLRDAQIRRAQALGNAPVGKEQLYAPVSQARGTRREQSNAFEALRQACLATYDELRPQQMDQPKMNTCRDVAACHDAKRLSIYKWVMSREAERRLVSGAGGCDDEQDALEVGDIEGPRATTAQPTRAGTVNGQILAAYIAALQAEPHRDLGELHRALVAQFSATAKRVYNATRPARRDRRNAPQEVIVRQAALLADYAALRLARPAASGDALYRELAQRHPYCYDTIKRLVRDAAKQKSLAAQGM